MMADFVTENIYLILPKKTYALCSLFSFTITYWFKTTKRKKKRKKKNVMTTFQTTMETQTATATAAIATMNQ